MTTRPKYYVTTPIYYVNDEPHIGHAYTTIVADTVARYRRSTGHDVRFLTGTDEHGQKIERAASSQGLSPIELSDRVVSRYHALWETLGIRHDDFIRTTEPRHRIGVEHLIRKMRQAGDIYSGLYEGSYCTGCESFYLESQIVEGRCPEHGHPVERVSEESQFFRLSRYQDRLMDHYRGHPNFVRPASRMNEVRTFVESGLKDLSISRRSITWGIPFPGAPGHVVYVWVDALTNYLSGLGYGQDLVQDTFAYWPAQLHLVGKDILRFHAVYWPAFLMSAGEVLPECVFAHGWWLKDQAKMSKSLGNVVSPWPLIEAFGADALRYFLLRDMTFGQDGTYSDEQLIDRYNGDLANNIGNLTSRILTLLDSGFGGHLPAPSGLEVERELAALAEETFLSYRAAFDACDFSGGLAAVWSLAREINRYLVKHAPWALAKQPSEASRHRAVLRGAAEALLQVAAMASSVMPGASRDIAARFGARLPDDLTLFSWGLLPDAGRVQRGEPLFPRVDKTEFFQAAPADGKRARRTIHAPPAAARPSTAAGAALLTIDDFMKLDLRVARVISAERMEGTDKLLKLRVDLGSEERQIVAGIAMAYAPEALVGKGIIIVINLKPAKLRGVESQGMLLAADLGGRPIVATFEEAVAPGTRVR